MFVETKQINIMKALKFGEDFHHLSTPTIGQMVIIKTAASSGWGLKAKVVRITKKQVIVECEKWLPTVDRSKIGTRNGLKDRFSGWLAHWSQMNKASKGRQRKFWIDSNLEVGSTNSWNASTVWELK